VTYGGAISSKTLVELIRIASGTHLQHTFYTHPEDADGSLFSNHHARARRYAGAAYHDGGRCRAECRGENYRSRQRRDRQTELIKISGTTMPPNKCVHDNSCQHSRSFARRRLPRPDSQWEDNALFWTWAASRTDGFQDLARPAVRARHIVEGQWREALLR
jgi:hypothetical protein